MGRTQEAINEKFIRGYGATFYSLGATQDLIIKSFRRISYDVKKYAKVEANYNCFNIMYTTYGRL